ncbi:MAG: hypothetical protein ABIT01_17285 [Thermoanaerobaculia bacterium]
MKKPFSSVADFKAAACGRVLRLLDSYVAGELTVESNHEILDHTEVCTECAREADSRGRLRASVRRLGGSFPEPRRGFEQELRARLSAVPAPSGFRSAPAYLIAAVVMLGIGVTIVVMRPEGSPPQVAARPAGAAPRPESAVAALDVAAFDVAASTQLNCADANEWPEAPLSTPQLATALAKGEPRFAGLERELSTRLAGYRVVAAHRCMHGGRLVLHLILKGNGPGRLSIVALPKTHGSLPKNASEGNGSANVNASAVDGGQTGPVLLVRNERQGVHVIGAEGARDLFFVSASRGGAAGSSDPEVELGRRLLPFLVTAITAG